MFIEYQSWGRKAGIEVTDADIFIYLYGALKPRELWLITTNDLKQLILNNNFKTTINSGDEGSQTEGYLIPRWDFFNHFSVYKEINDIWVKQ